MLYPSRSETASTWQPIGTAPADGTIVLVWCDKGEFGYHLAGYYDGSWIEHSGAYKLTEEYTGLPVRWSPLPRAPELRASTGQQWLANKAYGRSLPQWAACTAVACLIGLAGVLAEHLFDLIPG